MDVDLLDKLSTDEELSGFFNYAVEGLKRLLSQNKFSSNKSTDMVRENWIRESDSVGAFCLDIIEEVSQKEFIPKKYLYSKYCEYCQEFGYEIVAENYFHRILQGKVKIYDKQLTIESSGRITHPHAWKGIKFRDQAKIKTEENEEENKNIKDYEEEF